MPRLSASRRDRSRRRPGRVGPLEKSDRRNDTYLFSEDGTNIEFFISRRRTDAGSGGLTGTRERRSQRYWPTTRGKTHYGRTPVTMWPREGGPPVDRTVGRLPTPTRLLVDSARPSFPASSGSRCPLSPARPGRRPVFDVLPLRRTYISLATGPLAGVCATQPARNVTDRDTTGTVVPHYRICSFGPTNAR